MEVVAPAVSKSGASHSITFNRPVVCTRVDVNGLFSGYSIEGSPADCVKLAAMQLCKKPIELLVAGINNGANAGLTFIIPVRSPLLWKGYCLGIPSVATSLAAEEKMDYDTAAGYCIHILKKLMPVKTGAWSI